MFGTNSLDTPAGKQTSILKGKLVLIPCPPGPSGRNTGRYFLNKCRYGGLTLGVGVPEIKEHVKHLSKAISDSTLKMIDKYFPPERMKLAKAASYVYLH